MKTVIGVDLGTQSIKILVYDPKARQVLQAVSHPFEMISRDDGTREQMATWWIDGFCDCMARIDDDLLASAVAIGVSGQQHGFVPVDAAGDVLAPVKLWCDTATVDQCTTILDAVGGEQRCIELAGNSIAAGFTASKILWLKENNAGAYAQLASVMLPHDYLNFYLTGRCTMEKGDASGTGLLDVRNRTWHPELLRAIDSDSHFRECFPDLMESHEAVGKILPGLAQELGLSPDVVVSSGGGDNMMAAIGTGNVAAGRLTASLGTSGTLFGFSDTPVIDPGGDLSAFCSSCGGWLPLLCTMNCTVATEQLRDLFGIDVDSIDSLAGEVPAGANGVITLPFYNGERTPSLPNGKASVFGLDIENTTRSHLLRSAMESAIFGLKTGLDAFARCDMTFDEVTLTGGGSTSPLWRQICADVLNLPVKVLQEQENAAFGAALQALWCHRCEEHADLDDPRGLLVEIVEEHLAVDHAKGCAPDPARKAVYEEAYQDYSNLVDLVSPLYQ